MKARILAHGKLKRMNVPPDLAEKYSTEVEGDWILDI
jgi:hypothetical protein